MKNLLFIVIGIFILVGCPERSEESGWLTIEVASDGYFVRGERVDDVEEFITSIRNPNLIELHILVEPNVNASKVLKVLDSAKAHGFKEVSTITPSIP